MGSSQSTPIVYCTQSTSKRKDTISSGFCGRTRHTQFYEYVEQVPEINGRTVGKLIVKLCGNEGRHHDLSEEGKVTLNFLRAANSFIPDAEDDGADLRNTAFILRQPDKELVIRSGRGDWEFDFCEDTNGVIYGRCVRKPLRRYLWDKASKLVIRLGSAAMGYIVGPSLKALAF